MHQVYQKRESLNNKDARGSKLSYSIERKRYLGHPQTGPDQTRPDQTRPTSVAISLARRITRNDPRYNRLPDDERSVPTVKRKRGVKGSASA